MKPNVFERIKLRPVVEEDSAFLLEVYAGSREVELTFLPWDEAQKRLFVENQLKTQTAYYENEFPTATHHVILFDENPVGRIYIFRNDREILIMDMAVLPVYRKQGIGTALTKSLQREALESKIPIKIYIEAFNHSQNLFKNLGFEIVPGDDELNLLYQWNP